MVSRAVDALGLPSSVRVALGLGDSWGEATVWYSTSQAATSIDDAKTAPPSFALADMNDDELADLVIVSGQLLTVMYSNGSAYSSTGALQRFSASASPASETTINRHRRQLASNAQAEGPGQMAVSNQDTNRTLRRHPALLSERQRAVQGGFLSGQAHPDVPDVCKAAAHASWPHAAPECQTTEETAEDDGIMSRKRSLQATSVPAAVNTLPDSLLDCWLHPYGLPLLQNAPGQQLLFVCASGEAWLAGWSSGDIPIPTTITHTCNMFTGSAYRGCAPPQVSSRALTYMHLMGGCKALRV